VNASAQPDLGALRRELARSADIEDRTAQMLEVASIVQEAVQPLGLKPVVVGGLALASWVPSRYLTADIDVIMPHTPVAERVMADLGFRKDGRFWTLAGRDIVLEAPDSVLRPDPGGFEELRLPSGRVALVQSPEGVLVVRMEELAGAPVSDVFEQCLYLIGSGMLDDKKTEELAQRHGLSELLRWLGVMARGVDEGAILPEAWQIEKTVRSLVQPSPSSES
jgi:hypothetical protein